MIPTPMLLVSRCESCHSRFLPRPGPCPRCGSSAVRPQEIPPEGRVLAATELTAPAPGFPSPHRIALVEALDGIRFLAVADYLPGLGAVVPIAREGDHYVVVGRPPEPG